MFQVHHYDPQKEDREKKINHKKSRSRKVSVTDSGYGNERKDTHKRSRDATQEVPVDEGEICHHQRGFKKLVDNSNTSSGISENNVARTTNEEDVSSSLLVPSLRVIAPETEGSLSSQKNLQGALSAEAFDDLDMTHDDWLDDAWGNKESADEEAIGSGRETTYFDPTDEIQRALHMTTLPIAEAAMRWGLANFLIENLQKDGYKHFFPIQGMQKKIGYDDTMPFYTHESQNTFRLHLRCDSLGDS
jgi:hypothetical protein